jgi:hypothetical protein
MTTHTISIRIDYKHFGDPDKRTSIVTIDGDGDLDHYIETFRTALVAVGFAMETVAKLDIKDEG